MTRTLALALVALMTGGCAAAFRAPTTPFPASASRVVPWTLDRELLTHVNRRILVVVEVAAGHPPERYALDRLCTVAAHYGERPCTWIALGRPGAPPLRFVGDRLYADGPLDRDSSLVLVRYVGNHLDMWGQSYTLTVAGHDVHVIEINQERHRVWSWFLPERHLEAQTLVHEYGHHLGLPPCDHGYYRDYPDFTGGAHCVNPDCALSKPRFGVLLYGLGHVLILHHWLEDYCAQCRAAIAAAKAYWRSRV